MESLNYNVLRRRLPRLHTTEREKDPMARLRFYSNWSDRIWYVTEFDGEDILRCLIIDKPPQWAYCSLRALQTAKAVDDTSLVELDGSFAPTTISKATEGEVYPGWLEHFDSRPVWLEECLQCSPAPADSAADRVRLEPDNEIISSYIVPISRDIIGEVLFRGVHHVKARIVGPTAKLLFEPGRVLIALQAFKHMHFDFLSESFADHVEGKRGALSELARENGMAVYNGRPILSGREDVAGRTCWLLTESDRTETIVSIEE